MNKVREYFQKDLKPLTSAELQEIKDITQKYTIDFPQKIGLCKACFNDLKKQIPFARPEEKIEPLSFDLAVAGVKIIRVKSDICFLCAGRKCPHCSALQSFRLICPRCERAGCYQCMPDGVGLLCPGCLQEINGVENERE